MEKSNSRGRRNGPDAGHIGVDTVDGDTLARSAALSDVGRTTEPGGRPSALGRIDAGSSDRATLTPVQEARQRIQKTAGEKTNTPAGIQDAFIDERNDVLAVITELEDELDRHQEIRETLERDLTGNTEKLQAANQRVQELEWQVVTLQTRIDSLEPLRQDITAFEQELSDANARAHRLSEQLAAAEKERARVKNELKAAGKQIDELWAVRKERDGLRADYKNLSLKVDELDRARREAVEGRTQIQTQLQEAQLALEETRAERNQLQVLSRTSDERIRELTQVQESLTDQVEGLRNEKKNIQAQIAHLERESARLAEQRQFYECEVTTLRNQNRTAETTLASVKKAFSEVRIALTETKTRARRRTIDTWPRSSATLRGLGPSEPASGDGVDDIPIPASLNNADALGEPESDDSIPDETPA